MSRVHTIIENGTNARRSFRSSKQTNNHHINNLSSNGWSSWGGISPPTTQRLASGSSSTCCCCHRVGVVEGHGWRRGLILLLRLLLLWRRRIARCFVSLVRMVHVWSLVACSGRHVRHHHGLIVRRITLTLLRIELIRWLVVVVHVVSGVAVFLLVVSVASFGSRCCCGLGNEEVVVGRCRISGWHHGGEHVGRRSDGGL